MAHQIIEFLFSILCIVGFIVTVFALFFGAADVIETYLKFKRHLYKGDFFKTKDRE